MGNFDDAIREALYDAQRDLDEAMFEGMSKPTNRGDVGPTPQNLRNKQYTDAQRKRFGLGKQKRYQTQFTGDLED